MNRFSAKILEFLTRAAEAADPPSEITAALQNDFLPLNLIGAARGTLGSEGSRWANRRSTVQRNVEKNAKKKREKKVRRWCCGHSFGRVRAFSLQTWRFLRFSWFSMDTSSTAPEKNREGHEKRPERRWPFGQRAENAALTAPAFDLQSKWGRPLKM